MTVRVTHDHRFAPGREDNPSRARNTGTHATEGVPRDFVGVLARAPFLVAALVLALVALFIAILVMPIDEEVSATRQRVPWAVAVLSFAVAISIIAYDFLRQNDD